MTTGTTMGYVRFEAADLDDGAPVQYRYNERRGYLRVAFDATRPAAAAQALTDLFAHLQGEGIISGMEAPRGDYLATGR